MAQEQNFNEPDWRNLQKVEFAVQCKQQTENQCVQFDGIESIGYLQKRASCNMNHIKETSNRIILVSQETLKFQSELQEMSAQLLQNAHEANREAGGLFYRLNNLNPQEHYRIDSVLNNLHETASWLHATIKERSNLTIRADT